MSKCKIMTLTDGTRVRVNGDIEPDLLQQLADKVKAHEASRCHNEGPYAIPEIAQRIHGRRTYRCDEERGHDGPHRWAGMAWNDHGAIQ